MRKVGTKVFVLVSILVLSFSALGVGACKPECQKFPGKNNVLPREVKMVVYHPGLDWGDPTYLDVKIEGGVILDGIYDSYCLDTDRTIFPYCWYQAKVYSSYGKLPRGLIEYPRNLDLVNYIINQGYEGSPSSDGSLYTYGDVARAIWHFIEDEQSESGIGSWEEYRVQEIITDTEANGRGFFPKRGDVVAIILVPIDAEGEIAAQIILAEVPVMSSFLHSHHHCFPDQFVHCRKNGG